MLPDESINFDYKNFKEGKSYANRIEWTIQQNKVKYALKIECGNIH